MTIDIDIASRVDLLLPQYDRAERLKALLSGIIGIAQSEIVDPLLAMSRAINPDIAEGVLLDWLGLRLGLPRPSVPQVIRDDDLAFGFEGVTRSRGWNQAPFRSSSALLERVAPIGDNAYANLLKARARRLRGGADRETIEEVAHIVFGNGFLLEGGEIVGPPFQVMGLTASAAPQHFAFEGSGGAGWDQEPFYSSPGTRDEAVLLRWEEPGSHGGAIESYRVEAAVGTTGPFKIIADDVGTTEYLHTGVTLGQTYRYRVTARNVLGLGSESTAVTYVVPGTTAAVPAANDPPIVTVSAAKTMVAAGETIALTGSATDSDGNVVSVQWSGPGTFADAALASTDWTAPDESVLQRAVMITLTATDDDGAIGTDVLEFTIAGLSAGETALQLIVSTSDDVVYEAALVEFERLFPRPGGRDMALVRV